MEENRTYEVVELLNGHKEINVYENGKLIEVRYE